MYGMYVCMFVCVSNKCIWFVLHMYIYVCVSSITSCFGVSFTVSFMVSFKVLFGVSIG